MGCTLALVPLACAALHSNLALQHASVINVAYQTLKNVSSRQVQAPHVCFCFCFCPVLMCRRRAIHLLQLLGHPLSENDKLSDMEFLSDVLEIQEDLETCDAAALHSHAQRNAARLQRERAVASAAFSSGRIADAKASVVKLQYASPCFVPVQCVAPRSFEGSAWPPSFSRLILH